MAQKMFLITENEMEEYKRLKEQEDTIGRKITIRELAEYRMLKAKNRKMGKYVGFDVQFPMVKVISSTVWSIEDLKKLEVVEAY